MTDEQKDYIRPGLTTEIVSIEIPADRKPVVEVTFTDDMGQPLDRAGVLTPGNITASFVLAWWDNELRQYTSYTTRTQTSPITGVIGRAGLGRLRRDLGGPRDRPRSLHLQDRAPRGLRRDEDPHRVRLHPAPHHEIVGKDYFSDPDYDFRPDGGAVTETWGSLQTATCNACHDPLAAARRPAPGGQGLRALPQPAVGRPRHRQHRRHEGDDPQDPHGRRPAERAGRDPVHDHRQPAVGARLLRRRLPAGHPQLHDLPPGGRAQGHIWYSNPSRAACGSCHDDIDWVTGENHVGGPQADDSQCVDLPPAAGRARVRRLGQGRPHHPDQVGPARRPQHGDPRRDRRRSRRHADRHLQRDQRRRLVGGRHRRPAHPHAARSRTDR